MTLIPEGNLEIEICNFLERNFPGTWPRQEMEPFFLDTQTDTWTDGHTDGWTDRRGSRNSYLDLKGDGILQGL